MNNPCNTDLFDRALIFATEAHHGTERRGKGYPYIIHPMESVTIVASITNDPEMLAAAVLHDTVEDTDVTIEQINELFGKRVAILVENETAPKLKELSWRQRKEAQVLKLKNAPYDSKVVAMGDKLSNMRGIATDYRRIGDKLWLRFHAPNGKSDIEWYYRSLAEALSDLADLYPYIEYVWLLEETFGKK